VIGVTINEQEIAIYRVGGEIYATDNACTHAFALLSNGFLEGFEIECPLHFGRFDIRTGEGLCAPISSDLKTYKTRVVENDVQVLVTESAG
jgi:naphthalene 1,2-dioxygenase system ferredoxin subunit